MDAPQGSSSGSGPPAVKKVCKGKGIREHCYGKKETVKNGVIQKVWVRDNGCQTSPRREEEGNDDDEDLKSDHSSKIDKCPVCLRVFTEKRPLTILFMCGHAFCMECIEELQKDCEFPCPICREIHFPADYVPVKFLTTQCFTKAERKQYAIKMEDIRLRHVERALAEIEALLENEQSRVDYYMRLPNYCSKLSLKRKRPALVNSLINFGIEKSLKSLKKMLLCIDEDLKDFIYDSAFIPEDLTYEASSQIARVMIRIMKKGKIGVFKT